LRGDIQFPLAKRQNTPVRPTSWFAWYKSRKFRKFTVRVHIVADLKRAQPDVERGNRLRIFL
jgi:hypothetical protein